MNPFGTPRFTQQGFKQKTAATKLRPPQSPIPVLSIANAAPSNLPEEQQASPSVSSFEAPTSSFSSSEVESPPPLMSLARKRVSPFTLPRTPFGPSNTQSRSPPFHTQSSPSPQKDNSFSTAALLTPQNRPPKRTSPLRNTILISPDPIEQSLGSTSKAENLLHDIERAKTTETVLQQAVKVDSIPDTTDLLKDLDAARIKFAESNEKNFITIKQLMNA